MAFTYRESGSDPTRDDVRLLINDVDREHAVFTDAEIDAFLTMAARAYKLAAAQALDTIADNEALTSKVIRTQDLQTDGPKVADSLRKRAQSLRDQHDADLEDDGGFFDIVDPSPGVWPEHSNPPLGWP